KPWEYAIVIPIDEDEIEQLDGRVVVTIDATVHVGRVGFGVVAADLATYLGEEVQQSFVTDTTPPLVVPSVSAGRYLVVRNLAEGGDSSEVTLRGLTVSPGD